MRLKKIKLAGFKSFVDAVNFPLPSNRVVIVGPNGCGKSNIIDAVRWVMGESSAKYLRGDSMVDVIFNGSTSRKPIGQCFVELIFDNSQGRLGGQYATYAELAIKRQVSRDGQSSYFLNNTRCRRRDIADIFLGTGLGPRSYSIIEQGTISRLVEAKPEELRGFLEEAAGISKYKERRRETELRMKNTGENLARIEDLKNEIERQLNSLKRQAENAEKYQILKTAEREIKKKIYMLRWQQLIEERKKQQHAIQTQENKLEKTTATLEHLESQWLSSQEKLQNIREQTEKIQAQYYHQSTEITKLEQSIHYSQTQQAQAKKELEQVVIRLTQIEVIRTEKLAIIEQVDSLITENRQEYNSARIQWESTQKLSSTSKNEIENWQTQWEKLNQHNHKLIQQLQGDQASLKQLERQQLQLSQRIERLELEKQQLSEKKEEIRIDSIENECFFLTQEITEQEAKLAQCKIQVLANEKEEKQLIQTLQQYESHWNRLQGQLSSLQKLQKTALSYSNKVDQWIHQQKLENNPKLLNKIKVEVGWELAVERVIGTYLGAICIDKISALNPIQLIHLAGEELMLVDSIPESAYAYSQSTEDKSSLWDKVYTSLPLSSLFLGICTTETLEDALVLKPKLGIGESIITRSGIWLGSNWISLGNKKEKTQTGIVTREQEISQIQEKVKVQHQESTLIKQKQKELYNQVYLFKKDQTKHQENINSLKEALHHQQTRLTRAEAQNEHYQIRWRQIEQECNEANHQYRDNEEESKQLVIQLQKITYEVDQSKKFQIEHLERKKEIRGKDEKIQNTAMLQKEVIHQLEIRSKDLENRKLTAKEILEQIQKEYNDLTQRQVELALKCSNNQSPIQNLKQQLDIQLQQRLVIEKQLHTLRAEMTDEENKVHLLQQQKKEQEAIISEDRSRLSQIQIESQETKVRAQTLEEQIREQEFNVKEMPENLFLAENNAAQLESEHNNIYRKINQLGAINIAAIEEYKTQQERLQYLQSQYTDLTDALNTLNNAIERIDKETRSRFREIFDKVNEGLQLLFPKLFGGGKSYLELDSNNLLNSGVTIMARPPGKKNSTIHLLSGGEKALTAIALVFSIFQLNPAPFCMLDEVDAPLDEANVGRFCNLVKEMSEKVQFIIVTHNKTTMEIGNQLTGVTMHEPGVSRLVAVDIDKAIELAAI
ncbi:chromosome segregation protein SMC [Candidatus Nitrosacidococcus sp. I8]|uniref:chromosome segregation protein SMC n=1 Tax=Candidatus Nitrosacidococcus sp. I8 TaxID=2942908 RepID=UPI002225B864|nr:chromosome segregation protein SMC [Candidatus Nitrosacidococcus sp. I8]CAH9018523.1 Chromosome partition protein Smc [Candidatus Nitrosacidococcus sp. I8]